ncbi:MAG: transcription antitermination factor NusB [Gemmatimonadota bacterium]|nr:transcription antitermination factor NusB [Gemmatimonadota bacterium]
MSRSPAPRGRRDRSRSRAWFLQVHYRWETEGESGSMPEALAVTMGERTVAPARVRYLERLVRAFVEDRGRIEDTIASCMDNWRLDRLSVMDRGILRLGATEILCLPDLPAKVAIQEAVRLAERYGGADSPRFVNGVLDAVYRSSRSGRTRPA